MAGDHKRLALARSAMSKLKLFGERPLIAGESPADYDAILKEVARAMAPEDYVDLMYVRDISNLDWDNLRARRAAAGIVENARGAARDKLMEHTPSGRMAKYDDTFKAMQESLDEMRRDEEERGFISAKERVVVWPNPTPELSAETLVTETAVTAEAFKQNIDLLAAMGAMQENYELRRSRLLREYELRRARAETPMRLVVDTQNDELSADGKARPDKSQTHRRSSSR